MAATMKAMPIHLKTEQKKGLERLARANKTNIAEEVRRAIDAYLSGVTLDELGLLDEATKRAETLLADMNAMLDATNRNANRIFAELEAMSGAVR